MTRQPINFFKILRWKNVLIYILLQTGLYFILSGKHFDIKDGWFFLVLSMIFYGIGGNLQNNLLDYEIDRQKPDFIPFNKTSYLILFIISEILGVIFAFTAFYQTFAPTLLYAALLIPVLLSLYNYFLKKWPLVGNISIAVLTALAIVIPVYYAKNLTIQPIYLYLLLTMAFGITLLRELVKDMEDMIYEQAYNYNTLPIINLKISKLVFVVISIMTWLVLWSFRRYFSENTFNILLTISSLFIIFSLIKVYKNEYEIATKILKGWMVTGIIFIFLL